MMEDIVLYPGVELEDFQEAMEGIRPKERKMTEESESEIKVEDCEESTHTKEKTELKIETYELIDLDSESDIEEEFHAMVDSIKCEEMEKPHFDSPMLSKVHEFQISEQCLLGEKLFPSLCRLCAVPSNDMIDIFGPTILHNSIIEKIHHCLPVTVKETDRLTKQICLLCLQRLESCYRFYETVTQAEKQLLSICEQITGKLVKGTKSHHQPSSHSNGDRPFDEDPPDQRELVGGSDRDINNIDTEKEKSSSRKHENTEPFVETLNPGRTSEFQSEQGVCHAASNSPVPEGCAEEAFKSDEGVPESEDGSSPNTREKSETQVPMHPVNVEGSPYSLRKRKPGKYNRYSDDFLYSDNAIEGLTSAHQSADNQPIQCKICNKCFQTIEKCKTHAGLHASPSYRPCCFCNKILKTEETWKKHWLHHLVTDTQGQSSRRRASILNCEECGKEAATAIELRKHKRRHKPMANNREHCSGERFRNEEELNAHELRHTVKSYWCNHCRQTYSSHVTFEGHKKICSQNNKNLTCVICQKVFARKASLNCHMLTHDEYRRYRCDFCPMKFKKKTYLNTHRRIHTGECPYKCPHCGLNFAYRSVLKSHIMKQHLENLLEQFPDSAKSEKLKSRALINKCDECGKKFASAIRLLNHKLSHKSTANIVDDPKKYDKVSKAKPSVEQHVPVGNDQLVASGANISGKDSS